MKTFIKSMLKILLSMVPVRSSHSVFSPCPICGRKPYIYEDSAIYGTWYAAYCPTSWILFKLFGAKKHNHVYVHCGKANQQHAFESVAEEWNNEVMKMEREHKVLMHMSKKNKKLEENLLFL